MTFDSKRLVRQTTDYGRLRSLLMAGLDGVYLPPYSADTATVYEAIPGLVPILKKNEGREVHLKEAMPKEYEELAKSHEDLMAVFKKFDVTVYPMKHTLAIQKYLGHTNTGYWSAAAEGTCKVIGDVLIETSMNETVLAQQPHIFGVRDYIEEFMKHDKEMTWLSMPPSRPMDAGMGQGPGPWISAADTRMIGDKTIVVGHGVHHESEVHDLSKERAATNELAVDVLRRILAPYGWKIESFYWKTKYAHHMDGGSMSVIRPGLAVVAPNVIIGELPPSMRDWELITLSDEEALAGSVNLLPIDHKNAATCLAAPKLNEELAKRGVEPHPCDMKGSVRFGAGPACVVATVLRDDD